MKNQYSIGPGPEAPMPTWVRRRWIEENYCISKGVLKRLREKKLVRSFNVGKEKNSRAYYRADLDAYIASITEGDGFPIALEAPFDDRPEATEADIAELLRKAAKSA